MPTPQNLAACVDRHLLCHRVSTRFSCPGLVPTGVGATPAPELLLHTDLQRDGAQPASMWSLYACLGFQPVLSKPPSLTHLTMPTAPTVSSQPSKDA